MTINTPINENHLPSTKRATPSGRRLNGSDASLVKGMLLRGDRQHDIAAWFGVNPGRIADIAKGRRFVDVVTAEQSDLPPPGPYCIVNPNKQ